VWLPGKTHAGQLRNASGSGLVAFAAALGFIPLEIPPSVLARFTGKR